MDNFSLLLSILFFVAACVTFKKSAKKLYVSLLFSFLVFLVFLLDTGYLISNYFTTDGITESTLYYLSDGFRGAGFGVYKEIYVSLAFSFIILALSLYWALKPPKKSAPRLYSRPFLSIIIIIFAVLFSPAILDVYSLYSTQNSKSIVGESGVDPYDYYKNPVIFPIGKKRNIVFVYAESLEQTYSLPEVSPAITPNLNSLSTKGVSFTGLQQTEGASYTMAGMVASLCGVPLARPEYGNAMSGMDTYMPKLICLGDLLNKEGYKLVYYGGARKSFGGKDLFLTTHGFSEVYGLNELKKYLTDQTYQTSWGLYDDTVLDIAYNRFTQLSASSSPFGLFLLTLDTHQPKSMPSKSCNGREYKNGTDDILNGVSCSDYLISKFVGRIMSSTYASSTVIVIASDHLAPQDPTEKLPIPEYLGRSNRLLIISPDSQPAVVDKKGSTLDTGATLLPFIGYRGDIGFGRNLLDSAVSEKELDFIQSHISEWLPKLSALWDFPKIQGDTVIDIANKRISIAGRKFKLPVLVEVSDDMQTALNFEFDIPRNQNNESRYLIPIVQSLGNKQPFLLIHTCEEISKLKEEASKEKGYCLLMGTRESSVVRPIGDRLTISEQEIRGMISTKK